MPCICLKAGSQTAILRSLVQSQVTRNVRLLGLGRWTCLPKSRGTIAPQIQSRHIFGITKLNLLGERLNEAKNVATVHKIVKKKSTKIMLELTISLLLVNIFSQVYVKFVLTPLGQAIDDPDLPEMTEEEIPPIFIPLPLTWKEIKQPSYRGSDPEWQEFIKLSKQQDLVQQIRRELANFILNSIKAQPLLLHRIGGKMKVRRYWLDIDFPSEPPPEYIQSGIEIGNDYIALTTQYVDSATVRRLQRALWPSCMTLCTWSFTKVVISDFFERIANMIGFKTEAPPTLEQILARHRQLIKGNKTLPKDGPSLEPQLYPAGVEVSPASSMGQSKQNQERSQDDSEHVIEEIMTGLRDQFSGPLSAFKKTFAKSWKEPVPNPPRGCILVSGLVEIDTPKAYFVFDVMAHWDPKTRLFNMESLSVGLRRIQFKKQVPKD